MFDLLVPWMHSLFLRIGIVIIVCWIFFFRDAVTDLALHFLAKMKILVVKDIEREDVEFVCKVIDICFTLKQNFVHYLQSLTTWMSLFHLKLKCDGMKHGSACSNFPLAHDFCLSVRKSVELTDVKIIYFLIEVQILKLYAVMVIFRRYVVWKYTNKQKLRHRKNQANNLKRRTQHCVWS